MKELHLLRRSTPCSIAWGGAVISSAAAHDAQHEGDMQALMCGHTAPGWPRIEEALACERT